MSDPKDLSEGVSGDPAAETESAEGEGEARHFRSMRPPKPLDEDLLDELAARIATLPEPLAALAVGIEIARAEGDATGVRKRLFELGIGIVRYGFSVGLGALATNLGGSSAPRPLAESLGRAARISDGAWCELTRNVAHALKSHDPTFAQALAFTSQKALTELVSARNDFIHRGGPGDNALEKLMALLESTELLLAMPLRSVLSLDPPTFEVRMGTPLRGGVWRKTKGPIPEGVEASTTCLVRADGSWVRVSPFLPHVERRLVLADGPHAHGKPWRCLDPETGEHREHLALDRAVRKLVGEDKHAPQKLTDGPKIVGRESVFRALSKAAEEAVAGAVRVALLTGPFGVGRTRVARAEAEASVAYGFGRLIDVTCSMERRMPLRALRTAIEGAKGLERLRDVIERTLAVEAAMTRAEMDASIEAIESALVEASLEEPTVLCVDDAQWADEHTLGVLRMLADRAIRKASGKLFVIVTVRDEPNPSTALRRFVGKVEQGVGSGVTRLVLDALGPKDASMLVQNVAPMASDIERVVVEGAGGLPFFLVQPLLVWNETGALVWREGSWHPRDESILRSAVPGVRDLLRARLDSFFDAGSEGERVALYVLACVALYGARLSIERLVATAKTLDTSERSVEQALELLLESGLLTVSRERFEYSFAQEIVRQAALEDLRQKPWFRRVHRSLLEAVSHSEDLGENAAFLATGYEALGDRDEACRYYRKAISTALADSAFEQAIELSERLAKVARSATDRAHAELWVVDALIREGRASEAKERLEKIPLDGVADVGVRLEARVLTLGVAATLRNLVADHDPTITRDADAFGDVSLRIEARLAVAKLMRGQRGLDLVEQAIALVAEAPPELRYRALATRLELLIEVDTGDMTRLRRAAQTAREAARELKSTWAELDADNYLACAQSFTGDFVGAIQLFESIAERARALKFGALHREVLVNIATMYLRMDDPEKSAAAALVAADTARAAGDPLIRAGAQSVRADALQKIGDLKGALDAINEAAEIALPGRDYRATLALLRRVEILDRLGNTEGARSDAELARVIATEGGNVDHATRAALWLAMSAARVSGEAALEELRAAIEEASRSEAALRPPTKRMADEARRMLEGK